MKKFLLITVLIGLCTNSVLADERTQDYFDLAKSYQEIGNITKSLEYVEQILKREPENKEVLNFKLKLLPPTDGKVEKSTIANGVFEIQSALTDNYDSDFYNKRGREFYINQEYDNAAECFKSAIYINPTNKYALNNLGLAYLAKKEFKLAEKYFKKSNSKDKSYTNPLNNLSCLYEKLGEGKKRLSVLKKALKYNPNDYCTHFLLGNYYYEQKNYNEAIRHYKKSVELYPKYSEAYLKSAETYRQMGDYKWSNAELSYYNALCPKSDYAYFLMAKNYFDLKEIDNAKKMIYKAIFINNCKTYRYELGKINFYSGKIADAIDNFEATLSENSTAEVYNYLGLCYLKQKKFKQAIVNFNHAVNLDGHRPIYYYNLALTYKSLNDNQNYSKYLNTVQKIEPITYQDYIDLACIYLELSGKNSAISIINTGIEKYPEEKQLYHTKIKIYELTNDKSGVDIARKQLFLKFNSQKGDKN